MKSKSEGVSSLGVTSKLGVKSKSEGVSSLGVTSKLGVKSKSEGVSSLGVTSGVTSEGVTSEGVLSSSDAAIAAPREISPTLSPSLSTFIVVHPSCLPSSPTSKIVYKPWQPSGIETSKARLSLLGSPE